MSVPGFHPLTADWFDSRFGAPTPAQSAGWPAILSGEHTLIAAPTGSGKTLAGFLASLDSLLRQALAGTLADETQVVYISPLKALSNDIRRNLDQPLAELQEAAHRSGYLAPEIRAGLRTGDTPSSERARMTRRPPHLLVTTPESLYLLLTAERGRTSLRRVRTVIVDEIHALARDKRGSHLALSLERLDALLDKPAVRVGLSATQRPIDAIAAFLVGGKNIDSSGVPRCRMVDTGHARQLDLGVIVPDMELAAVCSHEHWGEIYRRLIEQIERHQSTLIFVNTRRMAERMGYQLRELLGEDRVAAHHGSMSRETRLDVEDRLKAGALSAIVATASLELGIDVGYLDLVCQIGSPRSIATFLQRVGRAGHSLGKTPKGRIFPLTRDELLESFALIRAIRAGHLDAIEIPNQPLDILAQQIVAAVAVEEWDEGKLLEMVRGAWPYRDLTTAQFEAVLSILSDGAYRGGGGGVRLHRDRIHHRLRAPRGMRILAATCGGAIPDVADYRVVTEEDGTFVGTVNEDFAIESNRGDIFLLGNTSWQVLQVRGGEVLVRNAEAAPATIPFWLGEGPGRTIELSTDVAELRQELADRILPSADQENLGPAIGFLLEECQAEEWAALQATRYVAAQKKAMGLVPTQKSVVFERFFDDTGGMQLVIHAPFGARINRAWGLALRKRFCRSFDFELQAAADDNGVVLSLGPQHSFPIESLFNMLRPDNCRHMLEQALLAAPMFRVRWRWNAARALAIPRQRGGQRVPPALLRFRADDFLTHVFPAQTACLENRPEDLEIPDHPLVAQTVHDCLTEAMDFERWRGILESRQAGQIEFIARDTREPSPFSHQLLNANPYAFLDDAPLEERRARAVATRRTLSGSGLEDLGRLDPTAMALVAEGAWPSARDPDELYDALGQIIVMRQVEAKSSGWLDWLEELRATGRAFRFVAGEGYWAAVEHWPEIRAAYGSGVADPAPLLPAELERQVEPGAAIARILAGRLECGGPVTASQLARELSLSQDALTAQLEALEGTGAILRGAFTDPAATEVEWCSRRLLARIHRRTLEQARRQVEAVAPTDYLRFLFSHQHVAWDARLEGLDGVRTAIALLAGFEAPAGAWEHELLAGRVRDYDPRWLDDWTMQGELTWGRFEPSTSSAGSSRRSSGMSRVVPISIVPRVDLGWLMPAEEGPPAEVIGSARQILDLLERYGASFVTELAAAAGLMPAQVEAALGELAAAGRVTSDGFAGIRRLIAPEKPSSGRRRRPVANGARRGGRWSLFPGMIAPMDHATRIERWAQLLLARYGVICRDVLERESLAPPWRDLAPVYRRLEARGEIRGGRFVEKVAGEQFALPGAVDRLRKMRDEPSKGDVVFVSACDPLNLSGIILPGPKVAALRGNRLCFEEGRLVLSLEAGTVTYHAELSPERREHLARQLRRTALAREKQTRAAAPEPLSGETLPLFALAPAADSYSAREGDPSPPPRK